MGAAIFWSHETENGVGPTGPKIVSEGPSAFGAGNPWDTVHLGGWPLPGLCEIKGLADFAPDYILTEVNRRADAAAGDFGVIRQLLAEFFGRRRVEETAHAN